jgi:hypothetical protein
MANRGNQKGVQVLSTSMFIGGLMCIAFFYLMFQIMGMN